jgi:hypothetical protein
MAPNKADGKMTDQGIFRRGMKRYSIESIAVLTNGAD